MVSSSPIESAAQIRGHPIHPMLIPFPIAFLVATFACDLAFSASGNAFWATVAAWSLAAAIVMAGLAAIAGLIDFLGNARIRALSDAWQHMIGNFALVTLAIVNLYLRYRSGSSAAVLPWGLILSFGSVVLLLFNGWKGGELVYRHGVGMSGGQSGPASESPVNRRAA